MMTLVLLSGTDRFSTKAVLSNALLQGGRLCECHMTIRDTLYRSFHLARLPSPTLSILYILT